MPEQKPGQSGRPDPVLTWAGTQPGLVLGLQLGKTAGVPSLGQARESLHVQLPENWA